MTSSLTETRYDLSSWDLSDLLPDASEETIKRQVALLYEQVEAFAARRGDLTPDLTPQDFLAILRQYEALDEQMIVLAGYSSLWFASDTQSSDALSFRNHMQQVLTQVQNQILFFNLWWKALADEEAARLCPAAPEHGDYRHHLDELRRFKPYTLDERSEQIINIKDANGLGGVMTLYSMLTNRLQFELEVDGKTETLTDGEMRGMFYSPSKDTRKAVYQEMYRVYADEANILGQIYANRVRDWHAEQVQLRGYPSQISVRNLWNDVPDKAVETLLAVTQRNAPLFQEYFRLKAGWLDMDCLRRYDMYAPLATSDRSIEFADATRQVLATFNDFDPHLAALAERVFRDRHIDSEIRKGKRGGAFCSTMLPQLTPWVLINYTGRVRDVATLAHELGHAVHSMLASDHSRLTQHPSLPLAETASVFSEMLITRRLLAAEKDPLARRELLAASIDDIYATVMRQTYFVRFELAAHQAILDNASTEDLCDLYLDNLRDQFGDSMQLSQEFRYEWLSIPHLFSTPFYCYAYSFGQLLVLALYRRYQQEGEAFKPGYLRLLTHGGSVRPEALLQEIGIDITSAEFWQGGFDVVRGMLDELRGIEV